MKKTIYGLTALGLMMSSMLSYAESSTGNLQTTAKLENMCNIAVQDIGFGALVTPLTTQSANSEMTVLCSKDASYTIGLAYGGIYGKGTGETYYWKVVDTTVSNGQQASIVGQFNSKDTATGKHELITTAYLGSYFYNNYGCSWTGGKCPYEDPAYEYGKMIGGAKRDSVAYSISVPGDINKIWNSGKSSYTAKGTGQSQIIPVNAKIVPGQSGRPFPAPDMYMDIITASISF